jgi:hypothetical protein
MDLLRDGHDLAPGKQHGVHRTGLCPLASVECRRGRGSAEPASVVAGRPVIGPARFTPALARSERPTEPGWFIVGEARLPTKRMATSRTSSRGDATEGRRVKPASYNPLSRANRKVAGSGQRGARIGGTRYANELDRHFRSAFLSFISTPPSTEPGPGLRPRCPGRAPHLSPHRP